MRALDAANTLLFAASCICFSKHQQLSHSFSVFHLGGTRMLSGTSGCEQTPAAYSGPYMSEHSFLTSASTCDLVADRRLVLIPMLAGVASLSHILDRSSLLPYPCSKIASNTSAGSAPPPPASAPAPSFICLGVDVVSTPFPHVLRLRRPVIPGRRGCRGCTVNPMAKLGIKRSSTSIELLASTVDPILVGIVRSSDR
jgi:hypothetical protein